MAVMKNLVINLDYLVEEIQKYVVDLRLSPEQTIEALSYLIGQLEKKKSKIQNGVTSDFSFELEKELAFTNS